MTKAVSALFATRKETTFWANKSKTTQRQEKGDPVLI